MKTVFRRLGCSVIALGGVAGTPFASAYELSNLRQAAPGDFSDVTDDLLAVIGPRGLGLPPAATADAWTLEGFATSTLTGSGHAWERATGTDVGHVELAGASGSVRLASGVQLGLQGAVIADTDDLLLRADAALPLRPAGGWNLAVRGGVGAVWTVKDVMMTAENLGLEASRGLGAWTPYAGVGAVFGQFSADGEDAPGSEHPLRPEFYAGLRWSLPTLSIAGLVDQTGPATSFGLRLAVGF